MDGFDFGCEIAHAVLPLVAFLFFCFAAGYFLRAAGIV